MEEYYKENPNDLYDEDYKIPFDIKSLDDLIKIKRDSKIKKFNDNNSSNNGNNSSSMSTSEDIYCFVHFLKCLLNIDLKSRFTASQCLHHPFITKEKFDSFVLGSNNHFPFEENTSQPYLYLSNTNINPNLNNQRMNNSFNSMVYNVPMNNSMSFEGPNNSSYCFQPNLNNIHMNWMRNFPFAMVDQCNLKGSPQPNNYNKTFMMTSFEKLNMNNSYTNMNNSNSFIYNSNNMNSNGRFSNEFTNAKMRGRQKVFSRRI